MSDLAASWTAPRWLIAALAAFAVLAAIVAASLVYMGSFDVAADKPHSQPVFWLMNTVRERSVAVRAAGIDSAERSGGCQTHCFRRRAI